MKELFGNKKILIAENSAVMASIIKNGLLAIGFRPENIHVAGDGNKAYLMTGLVQFDLITACMHMKEKNGIELLRDIRNEKDEGIKQTHFLIISADKQEYFLPQLHGLKLNGYLQKPFKPEQLRKIVCDILLPPGELSAENAAGSNCADVDPEILAVFVECVREALGQYMVDATAESPIFTDCIYGDFSSRIELTDTEHDIRLTLVLYFPHELACDIYKNIFGELFVDEVCGIVQELVNIVAGNVKPKLASFGQKILDTAHAGKILKDGDSLRLNLGLPKAIMRDAHTVYRLDDNKDISKLVVPFGVKDEAITMVVYFQKNSDRPATL